MSLPRVLATVVLLVSVFWCAPVLAQERPQQQQDVQSLWVNFNHYILVARPDLARSHGEALLQQADPQELLQAVEGSEYRNWQNNLERAKQIEGLGEVAAQVEQAIQAARIGVSREEARIAQDIELLPEGGRPYQNAVGRLRSAGQYAAPQLLAALRDRNRLQLHPYVMSALVEIGQPVVAPLSAALPQLEPATQAQVAQVLAEIGYPLPPLPYLRQIIENQETDPVARRAVETAYEILMRRSDLPAGLSAAELFLVVAQSRYTQGTRGATIPGYDASSNEGIVWEFTRQIGLVPVPVPGPIYADVLAMRAARHALNLNPNLDQALSVYLASNLRRENQLPEGAQDPSYPSEARPASFYAMLAGPARLHDVLAQAIRDGDALLALDAIEALARTAGTQALVEGGMARQPLLRALSFPDQMVRFHAAEALANARPQQEFDGYFRVVPVLAEVIRPTDVRYALIIASTQDRLNQMLADVSGLGFEALGALSLEEAASQVQSVPAVDLMVVDLNAERISRLLQQTQEDYSLGAVPVIARVSQDRAITLQESFSGVQRLIISGEAAGPEALTAAVEQALGDTGGPVSGDAATAYALRALGLLRDLGIDRSVYDIGQAEGTLVAALGDPRPQIVTAAGQVLALIPSERAQRALAEAALQTQGDVQISLLRSLGDSATHFGNRVEERQLGDLLTLVEQAEGETALAAARAHGALTPPTRNAVQMITDQIRR